MKPVLKNIKIEEIGQRTKLVEGRNFGLGFAFAVPSKKEGEFETVQAFSACKDYLNDVVFVENTKIPLGKIYGFKHKLRNMWKGKSYVYLAVKIIQKKGYNPKNKWSIWENYPKQKKTFEGNFVNLVKAINKMEDYFNFNKLRTTIEGVGTIKDEQILLLKVPRQWASKAYLISHYTLFLRTSYNVTAGELKKTYGSFLKTHKPALANDAGLFNYLKTVEEAQRAGKFKLISFPRLTSEFNYEKDGTQGPRTIHNGGIANYCKKHFKDD